jgi:cyanophycin synthetase
VRLVEIRLLEGPNVYALEPTVKVEVAVGRRRSWYGQREPGRHSVVHLGAAVPRSSAPPSVRDLAAWIGRLHRDARAAEWLAAEGRAASPGRARIPVAVHRASDPGHWVVSFPWRERERAEAIAEAAFRLADLGIDLRAQPDPARPRRSRTLARSLRAIDGAGTTPPPWIRDEERRIPVVSISGTNGKSTTTRMISHILQSAGRHVGTTTSDGVLFDGQLIEAGDLTGPAGARSVLADPRVEVGVLETARGGMVLKGIGYESNEASVLTNVSSDHLDLHGIHTLPELAEVKSTVARITKADGVSVLNADDALVAAVARRLRSRVCFFSMSAGTPRVRRHVAKGRLAVVLDDGWVVELEGDARRRIVRADAIPATIRGLARHNVANALAAAGAARALGATIEQVRDGLRTFNPSAEQAPGRLNMYLVGKRLVIVDFAHNEAGVNVVMDVAEGLIGDKRARAGKAFLSMVIGTAGDRPDDTLRGIGRIAAERADQVAIKETLEYLRGRTRASMIGELLDGIGAGGGRTSDVPVYETEAGSVSGELTVEGRMAAQDQPGILIVMCHAEREAVVAAITAEGGTPVESVAAIPWASTGSR